MEMHRDEIQEIHDALYARNGPCCAGCDWWSWFNSAVGECLASAPVPGNERIGIIGIRLSSLPLEAGHIFTPACHRCGDFKDAFDWSSLPIGYLKKISGRHLINGEGEP